MLREARFQVCHELLERGDLLKRGLVLELEILHDLHQGTHDRLDAQRRHCTPLEKREAKRGCVRTWRCIREAGILHPIANGQEG
jgi:hypothetical protein